MGWIALAALVSVVAALVLVIAGYEIGPLRNDVEED